MSRNVSAKTARSVLSETSELVKVFLLTIDHRTLNEPVYLSSDPTVKLYEVNGSIVYGTVSRGITYIYAGFQAALLSDETGAIPQVQISIPNAHRAIIEAIERMGSGPVDIGMQLVFADTPNTIEADIQGLSLTHITYDESSITGTISREMLFNEPFPSRSFTPQEWPYLFFTRQP